MSNLLVLTDNIIDISSPLLTVKELLNSVNYEYDSIFLDKFWSIIKDDIWIYIDDNMLKYIGYGRSEFKKNKQDYLNVLKENFEDENDYKFLFSKDFEEFSKCQKIKFKECQINDHNKVKHLIVSPDCFKQSLMLIKTNKSKEIKKYYIKLEKIFKFYLEYQNKYRTFELDKHRFESEIKELEFEKNIYDLQNNLYIEKFNNKKCIYLFEIIEVSTKEKYIKIGSTKDISQRYLTLKQKFKYLNILNVFECYNNYTEIEKDILNDEDIKNNLYNNLINGNKSIEIVKIGTNLSYEKVVDIVKKYINNIYSLNPVQLLENKKLTIESEKINLVNRLMNNGYNPQEIIDKLFSNIIEINNTCNNSHISESICKAESPNNTENIKIQYIKSIKRPTSKQIYKLNPETLEIIKKYETLSSLLIENEILMINPRSLYKSINNNLIYKNYRWLYEDMEIKPTDVSNSKINIKSGILSDSRVDSIIELNDIKDEIVNTYSSIKDLSRIKKN